MTSALITALAVDAAHGACSAALLRRLEDGEDGESVVLWRRADDSQARAETLPVLVETLMRDADVGFDALDRVAATTGPGSFGGVRAAVSTASGIGAALGIPALGIPSTDALVDRLRRGDGDEPTRFAVVLDAPRGDVFVRRFAFPTRRRDAPPRPLAAARRFAEVDALAALAVDDVEALVGSAARRLAASLERRTRRRIGILVEDSRPASASAAEIASRRDPRRSPLSPIYLSPSAALPSAKSLAA